MLQKPLCPVLVKQVIMLLHSRSKNASGACSSISLMMLKCVSYHLSWFFFFTTQHFTGISSVEITLWIFVYVCLCACAHICVCWEAFLQATNHPQPPCKSYFSVFHYMPLKQNFCLRHQFTLKLSFVQSATRYVALKKAFFYYTEHEGKVALKYTIISWARMAWNRTQICVL